MSDFVFTHFSSDFLSSGPFHFPWQQIINNVCGERLNLHRELIMSGQPRKRFIESLDNKLDKNQQKKATKF